MTSLPSQDKYDRLRKEKWWRDFWSKFNIAYVRPKGFAELGEEICDFIEDLLRSQAQAHDTVLAGCREAVKRQGCRDFIETGRCFTREKYKYHFPCEAISDALAAFDAYLKDHGIDAPREEAKCDGSGNVPVQEDDEIIYLPHDSCSACRPASPDPGKKCGENGCGREFDFHGCIDFDLPKEQYVEDNFGDAVPRWVERCSDYDCGTIKCGEKHGQPILCPDCRPHGHPSSSGEGKK